MGDLVIKWSLKVTRAIEKYGSSNKHIEIFYKILKNELEENFYCAFKRFQSYAAESLQELVSGNDKGIEFMRFKELYFTLLP